MKSFDQRRRIIVTISGAIVAVCAMLFSYTHSHRYLVAFALVVVYLSLAFISKETTRLFRSR